MVPLDGDAAAIVVHATVLGFARGRGDQAAQRIAREIHAHAGTFAGDQMAGVAVDVSGDLAVETGLAGQAAFGKIAISVKISNKRRSADIRIFLIFLHLPFEALRGHGVHNGR
jgi:hypothetical protein